MQRTLIRAIASAAVMALAVGTIAAPASAGITSDPATTTHWVDDDGKAGPNGCGGGAMAFESIQDAIDAADRNDLILVCPGTYRGALLIDGDRHGLTIRGVRPWTAIVRPDVQVEELVRIQGVNRVTLQWLRLLAPASGGSCFEIEEMVSAQNARKLSIRALVIAPSGPRTLDQGCGYRQGIEVDGNSDAFIGFNRIRDWQSDGIIVDDTSDARIVGNSLRYFHADIDSTDTGGDGIDIETTGTVVILRNVVRSLASATVSTPGLTDGIMIDTPSIGAGSVIRDNRVLYVDDAIEVEAENGGMRVIGNTMRGFAGGGGDDGFELDSAASGHVVRGNRAFDFDIGAKAENDTSGNRLIGNDFRGNSDHDCEDDSTGSGTAGTANTWTDNQGDNSNPAGICD